MAAGTLTLAEAQAGTEAILGWVAIWHTDETGAPHVYRFGWVDLPDALTYHGGFKEARVLSCDWFRGSTSPLESGQWQSSTLRVSLSDADQFFRRTFGTTYGAKLRGAEIALYLIKRSDWIAKNDPLVTWRGVIDEVKPTANWTVEIAAVDILTPYLDRTIPIWTIDSTYFPDAEDNVRGVTVPLLAGSFGTSHPVYGAEIPVILEGTISTVGVDPTARRLVVCAGEMTLTAVYYTPVDNGPGGAVDITGSLGDASGIYASNGADWGDTPAGGLGNDYLDIGSPARRFTVIYVNNTIWATLAEAKTHVLTVAGSSIWSGYNRPANHLANILDNLVLNTDESSTTADYTYTDNVFADGTVKRDYTNGGWSVAESTAPDASAAFCLRDATTLRDIIAQAVMAGNYWVGINNAGSVTCYSMSATPTLFGGHSDMEDIVDGSFEVIGRPIWNVYKYQYWPDHVSGGFLGAGEISDATSIAKHGRLPAPEASLAWTRSTDPGLGPVASSLTRTKLQRWDCRFMAAGTHGQGGSGNDQVGGRSSITHQQGTGGIVSWLDLVIADGADNVWCLSEQPESALTTAYDAVGSITGTYAGSPQKGIVVPVEGGLTGVLADGSNDKVTLASSPTVGATCSFEFWFQPDSGQTDVYGAIVGLTAAGIYYKRDVKKLTVNYASTDHFNTTAFEDTQGLWYHVVISISAGTGTFYINGVADGTFTTWAGYTFATLLTGAASANWYKGGIFGIAFTVGAAISSGQAAAHYAARELDRAAMGWTARQMVVRSLAWSLADLAVTETCEERVA